MKTIELALFAAGVAAMIILSAVVIWQMSVGNYYMTF